MLEIISLHEGFPDDVECVSFDITTRSADVVSQKEPFQLPLVS